MPGTTGQEAQQTAITNPYDLNTAGIEGLILPPYTAPLLIEDRPPLGAEASSTATGPDQG